MSKEFKPKGYNSVSPYFIVADAPRFMELLHKIFNAKEIRRYDRPDGTLMHAEMQIDDSVIMLGNSTKQYPPITLVLHVYVSNVDEIFEKAIKLGCIAVEAPIQKDGELDRRGTFKDIAGNFWSIGTQL